jgi:hypothetical protein
MDPETTKPAVDARRAFALLGHEIRLEILLALFEEWVAVYTEPKPYAELMEAVSMTDSGKFNYHLGQLRGVYVRKVEGGYVPTASATALYRAVLTHRPTETFEFGPEPVETNCPICGSTPLLRYDREFVSLDCDACEEWVGFTYPFPRNGFEGRGADDVLAALCSLVRHDFALACGGQCPGCAGPTTVDLREDTVGDGSHWVELACELCSFVAGTGVLSAVLADDRVASGIREIGLDPDRYDWELPAGTTRLVDREPLTAAVDVEGETGTLTVVVDEALGVRSVSVAER